MSTFGRYRKTMLPNIAILLALVLLFSGQAIGQQSTYERDQQNSYDRQDPGQQGYRSGSQEYGQQPGGHPMGSMSGQMGPMQEDMGRMGDRMGRMDQMPYSGRQESRDDSGRGMGEPQGYMQENGTGQFQGGQQQMQSETGRQAQWQVDRGMVRIGYDLNDDGQLDAFQYIPYYELQRIQQQYPGRERQEARGAQGYFEERPQAQSRQRRLDQRLDSVQGRIQETRTVRFAEMDEPHVIARIATQDDRIARVDLGPQKKISELNLKQNDQLEVYGTPGNINDKRYLMAHYVVYNQQQHAINRPQDKNIRSYTGQILNTRSVSLDKQGTKVVMARVRLQNGNTTMANLGPEKELQNKLNVQQGKTVHMLARPAYITGKRALVAESLSIDDQHYDVRWQQTARKQQAQQPSAGQTQ